MKLAAVTDWQMISLGFIPKPDEKPIINKALINSFPEVGWVDPFPIEVKGKSKKSKAALEASLKEEQNKVEKLLADLAEEGKEPMVIQSFALPNPRMMFKM